MAISIILLCTSVLTAGCGLGTTDPGNTESTTAHEVEFVSEGVTLSGTLWLPEGPGPHPALVIVHGSGRQSRNSARGVARHFNPLGIAVLGYDKRGVGESGGVYVGRQNGSAQNLTLLARDAAAGVQLLRTRADIDVTQVGLWGVSQAGWIVPMAATFAPEVMFTVLISGPTVTVGEENYYSELTGDNSGTRSTLSQEEISRLLAERGPFGFDPRPALESMTMPGVWLLGEMDESIPIPETVAILESLIVEHGKDFSYRVWPGANHGMRVNGSVVDEYWSFQEEFLFERVGVRASDTN